MSEILYNAFKKIKQSMDMSKHEYHNVNDLLLIDDLNYMIDRLKEQSDFYFKCKEELEQGNIRLQSQLREANDIITHVVFNSKDSQNIAYNYLAKYGLIKAERNNQI